MRPDRAGLGWAEAFPIDLPLPRLFLSRLFSAGAVIPSESTCPPRQAQRHCSRWRATPGDPRGCPRFGEGGGLLGGVSSLHPHEHTKVNPHHDRALWQTSEQNPGFRRARVDKTHRVQPEFQPQPRLAEPARDSQLVALRFLHREILIVGAPGRRPQFPSRASAQRGGAGLQGKPGRLRRPPPRPHVAPFSVV